MSNDKLRSYLADMDESIAAAKRAIRDIEAIRAALSAELRREADRADRADSARIAGASAESELVGIAEAAELLQMPAATLRYWRNQGSGPASFKVGRHVKYRRSEVEAWIAEQEQGTWHD